MPASDHHETYHEFAESVELAGERGIASGITQTETDIGTARKISLRTRSL
jgi:hypothetical protein